MLNKQAKMGKGRPYHVEDGRQGATNVVESHADKLEREVVESNHAHKDQAQRQHLYAVSDVPFEGREANRPSRLLSGLAPLR